MHCIAVTPLSITALDRLERIQRKAARICLGIPLFTPIPHSTLLLRINWPTLFSRRKIKLTLFAHSILHQYAPQHIRMLATPTQVVTPYGLRHTRTWHLPSTRTNRCKDSPLFKSLELYNALPADIREIPVRATFKNAVSTLLLNSICSCSDHPLPYS